MEDDMSSHEEARQDCLEALRDMEDDFSATLTELQERRAGDLSIEEFELLLEHKKHQASNPSSLWKCHLASLGDLGRKDIRHEQGDAGTTLSFQWAREYFDGFRLPYSLVTGNHDLEGLDEFDTDEANLQAWMDCFGLDQPQSCRYLGNKTLLLGLSTTRFRDAPYSSHEVHVDEAQLRWFVDMVEKHPADEGWKIIVLSHAPITGSGLRVLQSVHVTNGCAWLNHCSPVDTRNLFIRTVRNSPQIKMWFSGHFHLSHDYQDAISTMNQCTFCQVGVMGPVSTRDGRRQTRLVRGNSREWKIYTIQHHLRDENGKAQVRLDATMDLTTGDVTLANDATDFDHDEWFQAFLPQEEDGCYLDTPEGLVADGTAIDNKVCWWHMVDGAVLGLHQGQLVEYDPETLSPLGIVVSEKTLRNRQVMVVEDSTAVVLVSDDQKGEVVHPNDDGSYWRKVQRNKKVRQEEKAREAAALKWLERQKQQQQQQQDQ